MEDTIKEFKDKVKEYEKVGSNPKILKQLSIKERLAVGEMGALACLDMIKNLKKHIRVLYVICFMLALNILVLSLVK